MITPEALEKLKYPIGNFQKPSKIDESSINNWIADIESFPQSVSTLTKELSVEELNWRYRPDGWAIKQVVHHCCDSHMNAMIRFKLGLTEECPTIGTYQEARWAELHDAIDNDISGAIQLLTGLHAKWSVLLKSMSLTDFNREIKHPEYDKNLRLGDVAALYSWHSNHHLAHIKQALRYKGSFN